MDDGAAAVSQRREAAKDARAQPARLPIEAVPSGYHRDRRAGLATRPVEGPTWAPPADERHLRRRRWGAAAAAAPAAAARR